MLEDPRLMNWALITDTNFGVKSVNSLETAIKAYADTVNTWRRSFCIGAKNSLAKRITEILNQEAPKGTGTSLAVIDVQKAEMSTNDDFLSSQGTRLKLAKIQSSNRQDWGAVVEGIGFGNKLPLNTQMDSAPEPKAIR
jgi:hypothetical protein